jgi:transposase-like protein
MRQTVKRTQRDYTLVFKLAVVNQVEKGEMTYRQAQEHYGIQGSHTVMVWLRKHGKLDWSKKPSVLQSEAAMSQTPIELSPEQQIKALQVQLRQAQLKAELFEKVIKVLETDYGVRVVKKPLGKSCKAPARKG